VAGTRQYSDSGRDKPPPEASSSLEDASADHQQLLWHHDRDALERARPTHFHAWYAGQTSGLCRRRRTNHRRAASASGRLAGPGVGCHPPRRTHRKLEPMPRKNATKTHRAYRVNWKRRYSVPWVATKVVVLSDTTFQVTFVDGTTGVVDMTPMSVARRTRECSRPFVIPRIPANPDRPRRRRLGLRRRRRSRRHAREIKKNGRWVLD
jgi:hypothetical protein